MQSESGQFAIEVPRDREGSFEPQIVKKRQRRLAGFDEQVLSLYSGGLSTREIQTQLEELYGVEVSPTLISNVTDAVLDEVKAWRSRPLSVVYPIVYFDALCGGKRVNIRHVQLFLEGFGHAGKAQRVKLIECGMG